MAKAPFNQNHRILIQGLAEAGSLYYPAEHPTVKGLLAHNLVKVLSRNGGMIEISLNDRGHASYRRSLEAGRIG
jgi:hypothetical protein